MRSQARDVSRLCCTARSLAIACNDADAFWTTAFAIDCARGGHGGSRAPAAPPHDACLPAARVYARRMLSRLYRRGAVAESVLCLDAAACAEPHASSRDAVARNAPSSPLAHASRARGGSRDLAAGRAARYVKVEGLSGAAAAGGGVDAVALFRGGTRVFVVGHGGDIACWALASGGGGGRPEATDHGSARRIGRVLWYKSGVSDAAQAAKLRLDALRKHRGPRESPFVAFKVGGPLASAEQSGMALWDSAADCDAQGATASLEADGEAAEASPARRPGPMSARLVHPPRVPLASSGPGSSPQKSRPMEGAGAGALSSPSPRGVAAPPSPPSPPPPAALTQSDVDYALRAWALSMTAGGGGAGGGGPVDSRDAAPRGGSPRQRSPVQTAAPTPAPAAGPWECGGEGSGGGVATAAADSTGGAPRDWVPKSQRRRRGRGAAAPSAPDVGAGARAGSGASTAESAASAAAASAESVAQARERRGKGAARRGNRVPQAGADDGAATRPPSPLPAQPPVMASLSSPSLTSPPGIHAGRAAAARPSHSTPSPGQSTPRSVERVRSLSEELSSPPPALSRLSSTGLLRGAASAAPALYEPPPPPRESLGRRAARRARNDKMAAQQARSPAVAAAGGGCACAARAVF